MGRNSIQCRKQSCRTFAIESSKVVVKLEIDFNKELLNRHLNDHKEKRVYTFLKSTKVTKTN